MFLCPDCAMPRWVVSCSPEGLHMKEKRISESGVHMLSKNLYLFERLCPFYGFSVPIPYIRNHLKDREHFQ